MLLITIAYLITRNSNSSPVDSYCLDSLVESCLGVINETSEVSNEGVTDLHLSSVLSWACALIFPLSLLVFSCMHKVKDGFKDIYIHDIQTSNLVTRSCM